MHILLRPVPGLSATLERRQATFLVAAAKCTNIDSAIPRQAPPAITGHKNGTTRHAQECAPRNLDSRLPRASCVGTRRDGGGLNTRTAPIPARGRRSSTVPTSITDASSTATSSQPPAMTSRRSPCGSPSAWRPFPDRLPRAACSPDLSAPRNLAVTGRTCRGLGMGTGRPESTRIPPSGPRATERSRSLVPGGRRAEHSAHPGHSA